ncbi:MAG: PH domain-containing protein, partial [Halobacteriota archaeon]
AVLFLSSLLPPDYLGFVDTVPSEAVVLPVLGLAVVLALTLWVIGFLTSFTRYYGFRLARVGDSLTYERGLFNRYSGSIPLDKIQTLEITEDILRRSFGYATLSVETAGYSPQQASERGSEVAVPLAKLRRIESLAGEIQPHGEPDVRLPPRRSRRRYTVRYALVVGVLAAAVYIAGLTTLDTPDWYLVLGLLPLAPVAAHLKWRHRGLWLGDTHAVTRNGFWNQVTVVVPYYRLQTVMSSATVLQRRWRLATVVLDTASSTSLVSDDARAVDYDASEVDDVRERLHDRLQEALAERRRRHGERERMRITYVDGTEEQPGKSDQGQAPAGGTRTTEPKGEAEAGEVEDDEDDEDVCDGGTEAGEGGSDEAR